MFFESYCPYKIADAALAIVGNDVIVGFAQRANPDVQHALIGREIGQHHAIGRDLRRATLGITKQDASRNESGLSNGNAGKGDQEQSREYARRTKMMHQSTPVSD